MLTHIALIRIIKGIKNQKGQGMAEYILILGLIALVVIASLTPLGRLLEDKFSEFAAAIRDI